MIKGINSEDVHLESIDDLSSDLSLVILSLGETIIQRDINKIK